MRLDRKDFLCQLLNNLAELCIVHLCDLWGENIKKTSMQAYNLYFNLSEIRCHLSEIRCQVILNYISVTVLQILIIYITLLAGFTKDRPLFLINTTKLVLRFCILVESY